MNDRKYKFLDLVPPVDYRQEVIDAAARVINSGNYVLGDNVKLFADEFARYIGVSYCAPVANGFDGLVLALKALGVGQGDLVAVPEFTASPVWMAVSSVGAEPVFIDPHLTTYNMDLVRLDKVLKYHNGIFRKKIRAIIAVHTFGRMQDMFALREMAMYYGDIPIIEDCSHAHGAVRFGKAGSFGDIAVFSFYPTKPLGALGDAGAVVTGNWKHYSAVRIMANPKTFCDSRIAGINSRMDEIQAAMLRVKLKYLESELKRRDGLAFAYDSRLRVGRNKFLAKPYYSPTKHNLDTGNILERHSWYEYTIRYRDRDGLMDYLTDNGIPTIVHYPPPAKFNFYNKKRSSLAEYLYHHVLSLPLEYDSCMKAIDLINEYIYTH